MKLRFTLLALCCAILSLALPGVALGAHSLRFTIQKFEPTPNHTEFLEGPCGAAVDSHSDLYVSDYYHDKIDVFTAGGSFVTQISGVSPLDGPCGLAVDGKGRLYVNTYHGGVLELTPAAYPPAHGTTYSAPVAVVAGVDATGIALDPVSGNLLVDERTAIAEYESPLSSNAEPLRRIGSGSLEDGYGVAVSGYPGTEGHVYVADAASSTVKVYDPAVSLTEPVGTIDGEATAAGRFTALTDAAIAVDDSDGHLYVGDAAEGLLFEHPKVTVEEFDASGSLVEEIEPTVVDGEPAGIAVDNSGSGAQGDLYATDGNSEESQVRAFGPAGSAAPAAESDPASSRPQAQLPPPRAVETQSRGYAAEVVQHGDLRVGLTAAMAPRALPRHGRAPVAVSIATKISTTDGSQPPQLRRLRIEINREGHLEAAGLPKCSLRAIQPASSSRALAACRSSLVGSGHLSASVALAQGAPFPSSGRILAFNGTYKGHPAILAHVYGTHPFPTSYTLPFTVGRAKGRFGTILSASLPQVTGEWGFITGITLRLKRTYRHRGHRRDYLSAGCPAPAGLQVAPFPLARAVFSFAGSRTFTSTVRSSCRVSG